MASDGSGFIRGEVASDGSGSVILTCHHFVSECSFLMLFCILLQIGEGGL